MTKIAICDTNHFEVTYTIISLFDKEDTQITIFTHVEAYQQLKFLLRDNVKRFIWIVKDKDEANRSFIIGMFQKIRTSSFDLLYLNSVADNFIFYAYYLKRLKTEKVIMTLHDINGSFSYKPSFSLRRIIRYIGKRKLIRIIPNFNVLSEGLAGYLKSKLHHREKRIFNIPGSYFDKALFFKKEYLPGEVFKIVIPGSVDIRRRNYDSAFELLYKAKQLNVNISITLLGSFSQYHGEKVKKECTEYCKSNKNLHIYQEEVVPQPEFDKIMIESHFVWMPLQSFAIINDGIKEQYGISICSGNIGDVIRYSKPFFAPAHFNSDQALQKSRCTYNEITEILNVLKNLDSTEYARLQNEAFNASMNYTKDKIIERNRSLFK